MVSDSSVLRQFHYWNIWIYSITFYQLPEILDQILIETVHILLAGVYLDMYYGDAMTHTNHYQLKMYFICRADTEMTLPVLEHIKTGYDAHVKIFTKHAC